jgi:hypothetical protein
LRLNARMWGTGLDVDAEGSAEPWAQEAKANINLKIRSADIRPLLGSSVGSPQDVRLSSRLALADGKLIFNDLDSVIGGSRLRGRVALTLGEDKNIEGEVGLDQVTLAPIFALAIGSAGHDPAEPLGGGLTQGWRGQIAFQALRGLLPGGSELQPVGGLVKSDGQSLTFDAIKGKIGGGDVAATIDMKRSASGVALNASVQLRSVDGTALRYRNLAMPAGKASMQMTLASQGRSASALTGALAGNGTVTLESAAISGLDPRAFEAAIRASDAGQATDDARLRKIVEPVLAGGVLPVASAQIPFTLRDGRLRVGATTLEADGARAVISGGYDIPADQADIRATLAATSAGQTTGRAEIQIFAAGSPDALDRNVDVAALSSWLAVRAIDRETRRLDAIERGEPLSALKPASIPPPSVQAPVVQPPSAPSTPSTPLVSPDAALPSPASPDAAQPKRPLPKPKISAPRPSLLPPPSPAVPGLNAPVVSQQMTPLPPPIEVRPPPSVVARPPKPRPPLVLTPPGSP